MLISKRNALNKVKMTSAYYYDARSWLNSANFQHDAGIAILFTTTVVALVITLLVVVVRRIVVWRVLDEGRRDDMRHFLHRGLFCDERRRINFIQSQFRQAVNNRTFLPALLNAKVTEIGEGVKAIEINAVDIPEPFECEIANRVLYERSWYEQLLQAIHNRHRNHLVLMGSSGISKSTWQFWYMYRVLQAMHNGMSHIHIFISSQQ